MLELSPIEQKKHAIQRVKECVNHACEVLEHRFDMPSVTFNQRGKIAGSARLHTNEIRLNPKLLEDNLDEFLQHVIPHEVCHLLVFTLFGKVRPHGKEWQSLMDRLFDLPANPYHSMNVEKVAGKVFDYYCLCGPTKLSIRRHNKVQRRLQRYYCKRCNAVLEAKTNVE